MLFKRGRGNDSFLVCKCNATDMCYTSSMNNTGENKAFENEYLISFIIPAYNISDWLERCVRSIFCLGQLNFEF